MANETIKCKRCKSDAKIISASQNLWKMSLYSIICAVIFYFIPIMSFISLVFLGLAVMMAIAGIYMKFKGGAIVQCSKCNARYKINKYDYDQYKKEKERYNEYIVGKFVVRDYTKYKKIKVGSEIKLTGKFKDLNKMSYESFDYGRYLRSMGYKGLIYLKDYSIVGNNLMYEYIYKAKSYISNTIRYLYKTNSDFINSMMLGQKDDLSQNEKLMFTRTGTSHIIAISGLHTGILSGLIIFMMGKINKIYKLIVLSTMMFIYSAMVGNSPSIIRAIMFMISLYLSFFLDRKMDKISTLSFIGILFVINNPYIIYNISFP